MLNEEEKRFSRGGAEALRGRGEMLDFKFWI
jgi:hypothetical protein